MGVMQGARPYAEQQRDILDTLLIKATGFTQELLGFPSQIWPPRKRP